MAAGRDKGEAVKLETYTGTAQLAAANTADAKELGQDAVRVRHESLKPEHMPQNYAISLDAYRKGGTDRFLHVPPEHLVRQPMSGFDPTYVNIVDYIVRITHRIWEEKDIGYIYDTYSHDCTVWDDFGLQYGRDKIVADTVHTNNAFPDIRLVADEVIWAGNDQVGFHTSHRTKILGTNTGYSRFGPPTGRSVKLWCMANCVARDNEIFHEHVIYDTAGMLQQLGFNVFETAKRFAPRGHDGALARNFAASEPKRLSGQGKPPLMVIPKGSRTDIEAFVRAAFHTIWNRRNFAALEDIYSSNIVVQGSAGRVYRGTGQLRSFILSMVAMFPDITMAVDDLYWMGNEKDGFLVSIRWGAQGTHRGNGPYGEPTGRETSLWGISQWVIEDGRVTKEWMMFNEFGVLMQLFAE
jgi:hypothetical protein